MANTGQRITADCRKFPSEKDCQFTISCDKSEEEEMVDVGVYHAVKHHGHTDTPELREELRKTISPE